MWYPAPIFFTLQDAAAQLRAVAEERQGLQRQLLEAKRGAQEAQADAHAQEVAAAARLRERLALSAQVSAVRWSGG